MERKTVGIIGAMAVEVRTLIAAMKNRETKEAAGLLFHKGEIAGAACVVAQCGAGKVNAAVCAQIMAMKYAPGIIINTGVAGGVGEQVKIGDLVIAESCVQYDFDTTAIGDPLGTLFLRHNDTETEDIIYVPCHKGAADILAEEAEMIYGGTHRGNVATGDTFMADPQRSGEISRKFSAMAVEMEGGSIAQVCYMNKIPCAVLRAISDNANDTAKVDFTAFADEAAEKSAKLLEKVLQREDFRF